MKKAVNRPGFTGKLKWSFGRNRTIMRAFSSRIGKTAILLPATFLVAMGLGVVNLGIIFYMRQMYQATPATIGFFTSAYSISYFVGCLVTRPLGRKILPRYLLILSTLLMSIFTLLALIVRDIRLAFICYALYGFSISLFFPPIAGWISSGVEGSALGKTVSRWNISWSVGTILGPYVAGLLTGIDIRAPIIIGLILFFSCCLVIGGASLFLSRIKNDTYIDLKPVPGGDVKENRSALRFPSWISAFTVYIGMGVIFNIFPIYANETIGMTAAMVGIVLLMRSLFTTFGFIVLGRTSRWHFKQPLLIALQCVYIAAIFLLMFTDTFLGYIIIVPVLGLVVAASYSCSLFYGVSGSLERGKMMGIHESVLSSGVIMGSVAGGQLYQNYSMRMVFFLCLIIAVLGGILQIGLLARIRRKEKSMDGIK